MIAALIREARAEIEGDSPLIDQSKHFSQHFHVEKAELEDRLNSLSGDRCSVQP